MLRRVSPREPEALAEISGHTKSASASGSVFDGSKRSAAKALLLVALTSLPALADERIEFNRDIRPILSDKCFACHGPDKNKRQADLRLDTELGLIGAGTEVGAVVPGNPTESNLLHRIKSTEDDQRMPPPEFGKDVTPEEMKLLEKWIEQGATWEGHWAFQAVKPQEPPAPKQLANFANNPIDRFIANTLESKSLTPVAQVDPRTLVRRLYFDLTGLPPSPEVVEQFAKDPSPQAYAQLVERLLASQQHGERMAVWWMDLVRYADSVGYHGDQEVSVSPYRDYVIRAFHENKPFDQFTVEQLAGDLMPNPTAEQKIAAGYNRLGMMSAEGGVQDKEYLAKYIAERVRNLGGTWLGLTLGCCECHDHKFDPITTREFYQFEAFFADIEERGLYSGDQWGPNMPVPTAEQAAKLAEFDKRLASIQTKLDTQTAELDKAQQAWESTIGQWQVIKPASAESLNKATLAIQPDHAVLASGENPAKDTYVLIFDDIPAGTKALRLEVLPHDSLPQRGPGRAGNGNFVLTEIEVSSFEPGTAAPTAENGKPVHISKARATHEQTSHVDGHPYGKWSIEGAIDRDEKGEKWGWAILDQAGKSNSAVFEIANDTPFDKPAKLRIVLKQNLDNPQHNLGYFRFSVTTLGNATQSATAVPDELVAIVRKPAEQRLADEAAKLSAYYRSITPELESARSELKQVQAERDQFNRSIPTMLVTMSKEPRMVKVLARGNWMDESGDVVQPGLPAVLGGTVSDKRLTRMDLARWVVNPDNPLTARVAMNRIWKLFYGAGLSRKLDDLGLQGESPSHPELLDWMAGEFVRSGWDLRHMMRMIVNSETYKLSSRPSSQIAEMDPYNRLLSHQGRWRLDAEFVRDTALAVSGLLIEEIGGTSVRPYQPRGYWAYLNFPTREWQDGQGDQLYRRGMYTHWQRQYLHPSLLAFDAPSREECTADRPRSNTPLQALAMLNDPTYVEAARAFAQHSLEQPNLSDGQRVDWMVNRALQRPAADAEKQILMNLLAQHRAQYAQDTAAVDQLLSVGKLNVKPELDRPELAAWTSVGRTILNLHETITRN